MPPEEQTVAEELELYAGGEQEEEEEVTGDRGDNLDDEAADEVEKPAEKTDEEPEDGDQEEAPEPEADPEEDAGEDEGKNDNVDPDTKVSNIVSKERFEQVNERLKAAEAKLREAEAAAAKPAETAPQFDFDAKEVEYMELVVDGEFEKAKEVRREIRSAEQAQSEAQITRLASESTTTVDSRIEFNAKVEQLNNEFPAFNPADESYDQLLVDEVLDRQSFFLSRGGVTPATALEKAAREVAKLYDVGTASSQEETPTPTLAPKKMDVKKKMEQARKQPPKMESGSSDTDTTPLASEMTDAEFDALPESTKARLRGDLG